MSNTIHTAESAYVLHGVEGRMFNKVLNTATGLFVNQKFGASRPLPDAVEKGYRAGSRISIEMRFDDQCGNRKQSFSITGEIKEPGRRDISACGCLPDELAAAFPELAHMIKWHLFDTSGPMHYVANTVYHASNLANGKAKGEPCAWDTAIQFGTFPILYRVKSSFAKWIIARIEFNASTPKTNPNRTPWEPLAVPHKKDSSYNYGDKYTIVGHECQWYECPFDTISEAQEFCDALNAYPATVVKVVTAYSEGKARDLDAARRCAAWPEATDEQLCAPPEELKAALMARAPDLLAEFRAAVESCGMLWEQSPATEGSN